MAARRVIIRIRLVFWWSWYVEGVIFVAGLTGREPDWDKFGAMFKRAVRIDVL